MIQLFSQDIDSQLTATLPLTASSPSVSYLVRMPFNSETGRIARCKLIGMHRAAFWRRLGFPNLVLARKARWKGHVRKDQVGDVEFDSPFKLPKRPRGF